MSKRTHSEFSGESLGGSPIPALPDLTRWKASEIPTELPPLPAISDERLEMAAFTHSGMVRQPGQMSYEQLEFFGDAFIYHIASELIGQTFPNLSPGRCSQMRERLLRNSTLAEYSLDYGLDKRAHFPLEYFGAGRVNGTKATDKERQKALGDIFEAYVGALVRSNGDQGRKQAIDWLKALWSRTIAKDIREEENSNGGSFQTAKPAEDRPAVVQPRERRPKEELSRLIGCRPVKIRYEDMPGKAKSHRDHQNLALFHVGVYVDAWGKTELLATASALSKKEAGAKAAEEALKNKKAMKVLMEKKKAFLAAQESLDY
ncbi:uncharacterized protein E0L32_006390 [Thyridium curvatum]|uniref:RNase III domain-containing protein n=1 Tax=Thyridium curvatum TaxID=1093900 RepID=A0A507B9C1_9PEZI|nr:uncharacterized protein E0L32_006390 [Thyridium curvatum]TPX13190.1 hypothetical protein E0L32_006390 [Thyridium curvatum]